MMTTSGANVPSASPSSAAGEPGLARGDLLPAIRVPPPGPRSRDVARELVRVEAPKANAVGDDGAPSVCWREALGANVLDADGNVFVDLTSGFGVASIGHRHPRVVEAVRRQSERLIHGLGDVHPHPVRAELAARIGELAPVDDPRVFFAISGGDAVEVALKTALLATGRLALLGFDRGYHGSTLGALAMASRSDFRRPFESHLHPHVRRLPYGADEAAIEGALRGGDVAAVLVEAIVGREGMIVPPRGWVASLAAACRRHGTLLVVDEIFTGFGRTGPWFAVEADGVRPDLLCCGKALAGGLPIAAVVGRAEVMAAWNTPGECLHTGTFMANPLACAAGLASLAVLRDEHLLDRVAVHGAHVELRLDAWTRRLERRHAGALVRAVRGRGLMWGIEVASDALAARWIDECLRRGVLALAGNRVLHIEPPFTITAAQLDAALDVLEAAFDAAAE